MAQRTQEAGMPISGSLSVRAEENYSYDENSGIRRLTPTEQLNAAYHHLFEQLNCRLFARYLRDRNGNLLGPVPDCILTIQYSGRCKGFAAKSVWSDKQNRYLDQITIVFKTHRRGDVKDLADTLAHEMMHAKQFHDGSPGKGNYHNRQFADWMRSIGLPTSKTGKPEGTDIGIGMSNYIEPGGPFDRVMDSLIAEGFTFPCEAVGARDGGDDGGGGVGGPPRDPSKVKFRCPRCRQNAWAKQSARLRCGVDGCAGVMMGQVQ